MCKRVEARTSRLSSDSCRHPSLLSLSWMGNLLWAPERRLPRASQTTQVSSTSLKLSWDEIQNSSQLLWLPSLLGPHWLSGSVFKPTKCSVLQGPQRSKSSC